MDVYIKRCEKYEKEILQFREIISKHEVHIKTVTTESADLAKKNKHLTEQLEKCKAQLEQQKQLNSDLKKKN